MSKNYTAHILSHTHWDREWYLNSPYTNEWLIPFFDNLFTMIDKEPDYKFILDGQLSMIDDYFEELDKAGRSVAQGKRKIRSCVKSGSLFIGPYYLQPDWQLISDESLVRNLMIGREMADELGGCIKSGWLLDNFGQISQTAQIHKLAELEGLFVWRGVAMDPQNVTSEFLWESPDGTSLLSVYLLNSYRNVMRLAEYESIMKERMDVEVEKLKPFASTSHLLMMNGYDQEMIPDDIQPYVRSGQLNGKDYKTVQNDPDSYIKAIASENPKLPTLKGALYNGRFISVFPGVMSARMYLKIENDHNQKLLEKQAEPLSVMSFLSGGEYGSSQLKEAWKLLLKNHPHDSICGVSIDDVHKDMEIRGRQVHLLGTTLVENHLSRLAGLIDSSSAPEDEAVIVFNTATSERCAVVRAGGKSLYAGKLPPLGYKVLSGRETPSGFLKVDPQGGENAFIKLVFNQNGSFNLTHKETGRVYENQGLFEESGDSGDEYNYSFPDEDQVFTSSELTADIELISSEPWEAVYRIKLVMNLPEADCDGHSKRSSQKRNLPLISYVTIESDSPVIKIRTTLRNTCKDHRMRVLFPSGMKPETVQAASPFDLTERPVHIESYSEEEIPEHVRKVIVGAREAKPSTYFHTREFLDINDGEQGLAVFNKGLPEYQIIDDGTAAITLFRSVGWIAKEINTRIGDAGPEIYTPDAQCLREMTFEYAVCPHSGDSESGVFAHSEEFNNPPFAVTTPRSTGKLPPLKSWLSVKDDRGNVKITAVKGSEEGSGIILRGVNLASGTTEITIDTTFPLEKVLKTNILEKNGKELVIKDKGICLKLGAREIFTLKLVPPQSSAEGSTRIIREDETSMEDFSCYDYASYVTKDDIKGEEVRAEKLRENIEDPMFRRTALEAQLSHILTGQRKDEVKIRELGYQLNEARVQRRIHDYLSANISLEKK